MPQKTVHIVTVSDRPVLASTTQNLLAQYCKRHGYALTIKHESLDESRHISWSKIRLLQQVMSSHQADYYVWIDDDIVITDADKDILEFVTEFQFEDTDKSIMVSGDTQALLNAGLMILKPSALDLLSVIWEMPDKISKMKRFIKEANWEQECFIEYVRSCGAEHCEVLIVPYKRLQAFEREGYNDTPDQLWSPGDFCAHVSGMQLEKRLRCLRRVLDRMQQTNPSSR